jgi:transcriptional regulator with GAF, ATPase, and Fis domain
MQDTLVHTDTSEIDKLNKEAWSINRKDAYRSIELASKALEKASKINYRKGIAFAYKTLGTASIWISKNEEALKYCFDAISIFKEINDKVNEAETYYYVGASFRYLSDYDSAIKYYNECYNINNSIGNEIGMADGLNGLGTVYYSIEQNDKALDVLLESQKLCIKHNDTEIYVKVLDGLGETYHNLKQYDLASEYYTKCAAICAEIGNKQVAAFALDGLGRTYSATKKHDEAFRKFNESLNLRRELGFKAGEVITLFNIGCLLIEKNDVKEAISYLEQSFKLSESINSKEGIYKASEKLAELYEKIGMLEDSIRYHKIFQLTREEVRNEKTNQLVKSVELQHKMLQSQAEKFLLEEKAKELENYSNNLVLIGEIGQQIISSHVISEIVETVYEHVNKLMDATGFGIGLHDRKTNHVIFPLYIEGAHRFENIDYDPEDKEKLTNICFFQNREIIINDYYNEIQSYGVTPSAPLQGQDDESILYLPLRLRDQVLGVITVQSPNRHAYSNYHINILRNLASYTAIALDNAQLYEMQEKTIFARTREVLVQKEEIEKAYQNNKLLSEVGQQITSTLNFEEIFDKLYYYVGQVMDAACFGIRLHDPVKKVVDYKYGIERGVKYSSVAQISMDDDDNYSVWCIKNKKEIFLNDNLVEYSKYVKQIKVVTGDLPHSLIFYPIMIGERVLGVITIQSFEKFAYKPHHIDILKSLASYIAIALENASLYENMEEKVKERTLEVVKQKEEIEKTYENTRLLGQIGKDITSTLSVDEVIEKVYTNINTLMDASVFAIGILKEDQEKLLFTGTMEKGKKLDDFSYTLNDDTLSVWCFNNDEEVFINDYNKEHGKYIKNNYSAVQGDDTEAMMFLPIHGKDKKLGVLSVQSFSTNAYSEYHLNILRNLAVHIGIALDNASLYENMEERVIKRTEEVTKQKELLEKNFSDTKLIAQITKDISSSLSLETIVSRVYQNINTLMPSESFGIGLYNPVAHSLQFPGFIERNEKMPFFEFHCSDKDRYAVWCFDKEREIIINDNKVEYSKYIKVLKAPVAGKSPESLIYLPLFTKDKKIGVLTVQSFTKNAYSEYQVNILRNLALAIAIALDNASLYENLEEKVKERTEEVISQKAIIEEKNKDITDSIKYAKKIQQALMPDTDLLKISFAESFVYYRPKDIVSGDFYWIETFKDGITVFAAADCTGHGVPGAFMSLICNDLMGQVIKDQNVTTPGQVLAMLDERLRAMLNKSSDHSSNDGMDIALCAYHPKNMILQFAGAHRPLLLIRNGELIEYKPSKHSIGGYVGGHKLFDDNTIQLQKGDSVYVLTDGYSDQFGGQNGKKFKFKKLQKLIQSIAHMSMADQHDLLEEAFISWRGRHEQVDDVCVIGVKI